MKGGDGGAGGKSRCLRGRSRREVIDFGKAGSGRLLEVVVSGRTWSAGSSEGGERSCVEKVGRLSWYSKNWQGLVGGSGGGEEGAGDLDGDDSQRGGSDKSKM